MNHEDALHNPANLPELLPGIAAFARVAHHRSFTKAAHELGVSTSALSQTLRTLEARLGVRLLERSTRKVGLTELGQRFLQSAQPALAALRGAVNEVHDMRDKPAGLLRLNVSRIAAEILVMPHLTPFLEAYPDITVELHCDNALIDIVSGGFDAGIRLSENLSQDVVAVPLGSTQRLATVAAPHYLSGRTLPREPRDLAAHRCLNVRLQNGLFRWAYQADEREFSVDTPGPFLTNDGDLLLSAIRSGAGIGCTLEAVIADDIRAGRLIPLLEPWWPSFPGFHLYYSSRVHVPRKLRAFIDFMQTRS
ncbi:MULTISPECIES: LysR family transcriptional regulator [Paraburkholderia]|uniref:LysR family transcriptional regulator n=1 Tax=Paraburkholderia largidicola TaxID=3014751 RepID=A0A7I8C228_9BURK|nr:LysR family transcriptional regulator [Paraburkholderia sp. PGU16]BCF94478.1 LysR family transcriptional regulator [Paraburkholderia sp. PGU16]